MRTSWPTRSWRPAVAAGRKPPAEIDGDDALRDRDERSDVARGTAERMPGPLGRGRPREQLLTALFGVAPVRGTERASLREEPDFTPAPADPASASAHTASARKALHFMAIRFAAAMRIPTDRQIAGTSRHAAPAPMYLQSQWPPLSPPRCFPPSPSEAERAIPARRSRSSTRIGASPTCFTRFSRSSRSTHCSSGLPTPSASSSRTTTSPFYEADETTSQLWGVFARGHYAEEVIADEPFGFGQGITGWAVANREPVLANRADLDPRVRFVEGTPPDPESLIAVPLIARDRSRAR